MKQDSILLIGAGGHAAACIDVIEQQHKYAILGLVGRPEEVGKQLLGYPILGCDDDLPALRNQCKFALIATGQIKSAALRVRLFQIVSQLGFVLPSIISPYAYVSPHAQISDGTIVMHGAIINANAVVGKNCIINSRSLVEHDAHISNHCHISTASIINGGVTVGEGTFIGSSSCIRESLTIGAKCLIGMGQSVRVHCADNTRIASIREKV